MIELETFHQSLNRYFRELPLIFSRHFLTQKLSERIRQGLVLNESPFTVAVVGQMRIGKSSLLNTLIGAELAVTGVNETTATINWFKYAPEEKCNKFRVIWKNKPEEEFPLDEIQKWIGDSQLAAETQQLEFFANTPFLKNAYIVDTPGTRTVIESQIQITREFLFSENYHSLSDKHDSDTRQQGDKSDAIIYVLGYVARETDMDMLDLFKVSTSIPGAAPYNSLAVIHKWETIDATDPYAEVLPKVARIRESLKEQIADAIPVSAPLGWAAEHFNMDFWNKSFELGKQDKKILAQLLLIDKYFDAENKDCSVSVEERKLLRQENKLPWASLKFIINRVAIDNIKSPEQLKDRILELSGIIQLREILDKRFFSRSKMIRQFGVLSKTLPVCEEATTALRNHKVAFSKLLEQAQIAADEKIPESVRNYIIETKNIVEADLNEANNAQNDLDKLIQPIKDIFESMNNDTKLIDRLDTLDKYESLKDWKLKLAYLFGQGGTKRESRISLIITNWESLNTNEKISMLDEKLSQLKSFNETNKEKEIKEILNHAINIIEQIMNDVEKK